MTIAVIGGTGSVGSNALAALDAASAPLSGDRKVAGQDRPAAWSSYFRHC